MTPLLYIIRTLVLLSYSRRSLRYKLNGHEWVNLRWRHLLYLIRTLAVLSYFRRSLRYKLTLLVRSYSGWGGQRQPDLRHPVVQNRTCCSPKTLRHWSSIRGSPWEGRIVPSRRPDAACHARSRQGWKVKVGSMSGQVKVIY